MTADPLAVLARLAADGPLDADALAHELGTQPGRVAIHMRTLETLDPLVDRGLVHRATTRAGRHLYSLTAHGRAVAHALNSHTL